MIEELLDKVNKAAFELAKLNTAEKNQCLLNIQKALIMHQDKIIKANEKDLENASSGGMTLSMLDRLKLDKKRLDGIVSSVTNIIALDDPIGEIEQKWTRPSGIEISKVRVPFGVIGVIYEARPNVSVDIATLCLKTSNACLLKGGKEALETNKILVSIMQDAIKDIVDKNAITLIDNTSREATKEMLEAKGKIDLLIPRGSKRLIDFVVNNAKVPYIETGAGNCHLYVHEKADLNKAIKIAINAKYQRPSVCNAIENILVDEAIANKFLPMLYKEFTSLNIEMRGDDKTRSIINCLEATEEDFYTEYNALIVSIKVVGNIDEAIAHINKHSSKHSEAIISEDDYAITKFLNEIDSACVYANASTRFSDGGEFGFGAEIGISTTKLHARGPMGLKEITTYKYEIRGNGNVRS